jgi:ketosteroid isomerase-like protein
MTEIRIRVTLLLTLIACSSAPVLFGQQANGSYEAELRAVMAERHKASLEGDSEKIAASITDDYLQTDTYGFVQNKDTWLKQYFIPLAELIKAHKFRWEAYDEKDVQIRIHGDTAIVIGILEAKGSGARVDVERHTWIADPNASLSAKLYFTRVYVRRNGKWLLAALHNSLLPRMPAPPQKQP